MGRTNPTYRDALRAIEERWQDFRRALRRRDQPQFDQLFAYAREHADASGLLNHQNPLLPALLSMISNKRVDSMNTKNGLRNLKRQLKHKTTNSVSYLNLDFTNRNFTISQGHQVRRRQSHQV